MKSRKVLGISACQIELSCIGIFSWLCGGLRNTHVLNFSVFFSFSFSEICGATKLLVILLLFIYLAKTLKPEIQERIQYFSRTNIYILLV